VRDLEKLCYIVGAMPVSELKLPGREEALLIAADAGYGTLRRMGISPDLVVGDFDSLGGVPEHPHVIRHPVEKDDTDTLLAARLGLEQGCRTFVIYGGLGGLLDHTWANCQTLLWLAERGARGYLLGEDGQCVTALKDEVLFFGPGHIGRISVFAAGERAEGVSLRGLQYPLEGAQLVSSFPLGVSNAFTGAAAEVAVEDGSLLVMWQQEAADAAERIASGRPL